MGEDYAALCTIIHEAQNDDAGRDEGQMRGISTANLNAGNTVDWRT
jgi:hypothetical protein